MTPDIDPAALGARRDDDLQEIIDQISAPNPSWSDLNLPVGLTCDGAGAT
jgi:hypothetical protein